MPSIVRGEVGGLSTTSVSMMLVSAALFDAERSLANSPVATRRRDILGMPYVCGIVRQRGLVWCGLGLSGGRYFKNGEEDGFGEYGGELEFAEGKLD